jgi:hypothetical protein
VVYLTITDLQDFFGSVDDELELEELELEELELEELELEELELEELELLGILCGTTS